MRKATPRQLTESAAAPHFYLTVVVGVDNFTAVINPPEAAILAIGAATQEPFIQDGELHSRSIMKITMTSDHRVLDGATAAAFLSELKERLEDPLRIVI